jgi:hypothetical protein
MNQNEDKFTFVGLMLAIGVILVGSIIIKQPLGRPVAGAIGGIIAVVGMLGLFTEIGRYLDERRRAKGR